MQQRFNTPTCLPFIPLFKHNIIKLSIIALIRPLYTLAEELLKDFIYLDCV